MKKEPPKGTKTGKGGFTLGRERFAKISAVEGIDLAGRAHGTLRGFDKAGLSADARRAAVTAQFKRKPD